MACNLTTQPVTLIREFYRIPSLVLTISNKLQVQQSVFRSLTPRLSFGRQLMSNNFENQISYYMFITYVLLTTQGREITAFVRQVDSFYKFCFMFVKNGGAHTQILSILVFN